MSTGRNKITRVWLFAVILGIGLGTTSTQASPTPQPLPATKSAPTRAVPAPIAKEAPAPKSDASSYTLRRLKGSEMSVPLVKKAREIINEHYKKPFGTDIEFELDKKRYVGRIEKHYHPPGGALHPWGYHPGCSLFIVENAS